MFYTEEEVKLLVELFDNTITNFDRRTSSDAEDLEEALMNITDNKLSEEFEWIGASGASKFVMVMQNKPFVVKIPFTGSYCDDYDYCESQYCVYDSQGNSVWRPNPNYDSNYDSYFEYECGEDGGYDYCATEVSIYNTAKEQYPGAELFLAETVRIGDDMYVQQKATKIGGWGKVNNSLSRDELNSIRESTSQKYKSAYRVPREWLVELVVYCTNNNLLSEMEAFFAFLESESISDLHSNNVGFINDKPVLIDYSGFDS